MHQEASPIPAALLDLDDHEFEQMVRQHLPLPRRRGTPEPMWDVLLDPLCVQRTADVLSAIETDINGELAARAADRAAFQQECWTKGEAGKQAWFDSEGPYQDWRSRRAWLKRSIQARASHARRLAKAQRVDDSERYRRLRAGIRAHQKASAEGGYDPEPHDQELWGLLDELA